jgi:hypothetical protein
MSGAHFNFNGGILTGNAPVLTNSVLSIAAGSTGAGTFLMRGSSGLSGDVAADQTVTAQAAYGMNTVLTAANGFTNSGAISLDSTAGYNSTLGVTSGTLLNAAGGRLSVKPGAGGARILSLQLDNRGALTLETSASLGKSGADHRNTGLLSVVAGTTTLVGHTFVNDPDGLIQGNGTLNVSGLTFTNSGTIAPGLSPGLLSMTGTYNQSATGILKIEIGGPSAGTNYDRLAVAGTANLGGLLDLSLVNGFVPGSSDVFTVLTASRVNGFFANAPGTITFPGGTFDVTYTNTFVALTNFVPEPSVSALLALGSMVVFRRRSGFV